MFELYKRKESITHL